MVTLTPEGRGFLVVFLTGMLFVQCWGFVFSWLALTLTLTLTLWIDRVALDHVVVLLLIADQTTRRVKP
jgi:uncharacterized membrane protein YdjX (TVP38/TMEM64 family)